MSVIHPRRRLAGFDYSDADATYFVTMRTAMAEPVFTDRRLCSICIDSLDWMRANRGVAVYAFCLMPDHLHLLMQLGTDGRPLGEVIAGVKRHTKREGATLGRAGELWQDRFYDRILRQGDDAGRIVDYILENPVRKGLVERAEDYPYSGTPDPI